MRLIAPIAALLAVAACAPAVPNSAVTVDEGVGFQSYNRYTQERVLREAELRRQSRQTVLPPTTPALPVLPPVQTAAAAPAPVSAPAPASTPVPTVANTTLAAAAAPEPTTAAAVATVNNPGISDEQDFAAVTERETIESDRERLEQQRQQYQVIQPTAVPTRRGGEDPNIVKYALGTRNAVGQSIYKRSKIFSASKFQRNCAKYVAPDRAQEDFLRNGGPQRDRLGLDPDGDGFACAWDPTPFRRAVN